MVKVVSPLPVVICYLVDLADYFAQLSPCGQVIFTANQNFSFHLFSDFHGSEAFFSVDGLGDETASLHLNAHQFQDIKPFEGAPTYVELIEIILDFGGTGLQEHIIGLLSDFSIEIPETVL